MRVRLIKKLAERIDGIDLRHCAPGEVIDLAGGEARLLIAEGWGTAERRSERREYASASCSTDAAPLARAADRPMRSKLQRVTGDAD